MDEQDFEIYLGMEQETPKSIPITSEPDYYITEAGEHLTVIYDEELFLIRILFTKIPSGLTRVLMKNHGFIWNRDLNSWTLSMIQNDIRGKVNTMLATLGAETNDEF